MLALAAIALAAGAGVGVGALVGGGSHAGANSQAAARHGGQPAPQSVTATAAKRDQSASPAQRRKALEGELEAAIAQDARMLVTRRFLQGPILGATCVSMGRVEATMEGVVGHYNCLAISRRIPSTYQGAPDTLEGARYFATINFTNGTFTKRGD